MAQDDRLDRWAEELECIIVTVDYRLSPEHPYPTPLEDCYAGLLWTYESGQTYGIDTTRVIIGGDSAGGGLAAGLGLLARDRGEFEPVLQVLLCPMIDDRCLSPSSFMQVPTWSREFNLLGWSAYLSDIDKSGEVPIYAAPARASAAQLANLPPTFIGIGTLDLFRDETICFAAALLEAGVEVELHVYPGAPHSFERLAPGAALSRCFQTAIDQALRNALTRRTG